MKNSYIYVLSITLLFSCNSEPKEEDIKDGFKEFVSEYIDSYKTNKRQRVTRLGGGWAKEEYSVVESTYDIQSTNSLVSPYLGVCKLTIKRDYTDFVDTKEAASNSKKFVASDISVHIHKYHYKDNKWIISERAHTSSAGGWYDCNETIEKGDNKGESNLFGCWEENL